MYVQYAWAFTSSYIHDRYLLDSWEPRVGLSCRPRPAARAPPNGLCVFRRDGQSYVRRTSRQPVPCRPRRLHGWLCTAARPPGREGYLRPLPCRSSSPPGSHAVRTISLPPLVQQPPLTMGFWAQLTTYVLTLLELGTTPSSPPSPFNEGQFDLTNPYAPEIFTPEIPNTLKVDNAYNSIFTTDDSCNTPNSRSQWCGGKTIKTDYEIIAQTPNTGRTNYVSIPP